jgi:hypothetical protein
MEAPSRGLLGVGRGKLRQEVMGEELVGDPRHLRLESGGRRTPPLAVLMFTQVLHAVPKPVCLDGTSGGGRRTECAAAAAGSDTRPREVAVRAAYG